MNIKPQNGKKLLTMLKRRISSKYDNKSKQKSEMPAYK